MDKVHLRLVEAIAHYNRNRGKKARMTQRSLAPLVIPELSSDQAERYISQWKQGKSLSYFMPLHAVRLAKACGVDINFLFNFNQS